VRQPRVVSRAIVPVSPRDMNTALLRLLAASAVLSCVAQAQLLHSPSHTAPWLASNFSSTPWAAWLAPGEGERCAVWWGSHVGTSGKTCTSFPRPDGEALQRNRSRQRLDGRLRHQRLAGESPGASPPQPGLLVCVIAISADATPRNRATPRATSATTRRRDLHITALPRASPSFSWWQRPREQSWRLAVVASKLQISTATR